MHPVRSDCHKIQQKCWSWIQCTQVKLRIRTTTERKKEIGSAYRAKAWIRDVWQLRYNCIQYNSKLGKNYQDWWFSFELFFLCGDVGVPANWGTVRPHFTVNEFPGKDANIRMNKTDWLSWLPTWNLYKFTLRQNDSKNVVLGVRWNNGNLPHGNLHRNLP